MTVQTRDVSFHKLSFYANSLLELADSVSYKSFVSFYIDSE